MRVTIICPESLKGDFNLLLEEPASTGPEGLPTEPKRHFQGDPSWTDTDGNLYYVSSGIWSQEKLDKVLEDTSFLSSEDTLDPTVVSGLIGMNPVPRLSNLGLSAVEQQEELTETED